MFVQSPQDANDVLGAGGSKIAPDDETRAQLEALGYLGPVPERDGIPEIRTDSPESMEPVDMTQLSVQDRHVHLIRIQHVHGVELGAVESRQLAEASRVYARWGVAHPDFAARSQWRIREVEALARSAGISLDVGAAVSPAPAR